MDDREILKRLQISDDACEAAEEFKALLKHQHKLPCHLAEVVLRSQPSLEEAAATFGDDCTPQDLERFLRGHSSLREIPAIGIFVFKAGRVLEPINPR